MHKTILLTFILCFLSTQVLGSVAYKSEHKMQDDVHSFMHELDVPHTHEHQDESKFTFSYSSEALEHINQDEDFCAIDFIDAVINNLPESKPISAMSWNANKWPPPFLNHAKPPPRI